ncbi:MAG: Diguanylate cyclase/phosphodiesterase [Bacteroidetes bacterium]|nr:MAG: Diguanylate cyclase/phosphodiesterase [Bacteroidota bacterium]
MKKQNKSLTDAALLRQKAEEQMKLRKSGTNKTVSEADLLKLIYELEVHQIELELQNEELVIAKEKAELAEEKYTELYDFAPSGYLTLSKTGEIKELNFSAASMLGKERSKLIEKRFDFFVSIDTQTTFDLFLLDVFTSKVKQTCEVIIATDGNLPIYVNIDGIVSQDIEFCLLTITDITERKREERNLLDEKEHVEVSENKFRTLSENSPVIIYRILLKPTFKFDYVSPVVTKITGYTPEDHYADPELGFKLVHPDDRIILEETKHKTQGEPIILRWITKSGKIIWTEQRNVLIFDTAGNPSAIEGIATDITLQKEAEEALENSMQMLEKTMYSLLDAVLIIDADTVKIMDCNPAASTIFGYSRQEMLGQTTAFLHVDEASLEVFRQHLNSDMKAGKEFMFLPEFKMKHKNGTVFFSEHSVVPLKNKLGQRIGWVSVVRDITERKNAELALIESELFANTIASSTPALLYLYDFEKEENIWTNDAHKRFFEEINKNAGGMQFDEIVQLIHPDDINSVVAHQSELNDTESISRFNTEIRIKCKDSWKWMTHVVKVFKTDNTGKPLQLLGALFDIDEIKRTQQNLLDAKERAEENENFFRSIFENSPVGKSLTGLDGSLKTNKAFSDILGYSFDEFQKFNMKDITHPDDLQKSLDVIENLLKGEESVIHFEKKYIHKNGSIVYSEVATTLHKNSDGKPLLFITSVNNITERKQAEEKIIKTGQHYQALIEKAPDGIALIDAQGNFRYISPAAKKMFGYAQSDEISGNPAESTHPDDLQMVLAELGKIFEDPAYVPTLEYRFIDKHGQWHWIKTTFSNLLANPNVESIVLNFHDITEHKLSVAMFKDIIVKNPMSIQILDMEGFPIQVNPAHTKLFGVEPPSDYSIFKDNQLLSLGFSKLFERIKRGEVVYFPDSYYNVHDVDPSFPDSPAWVRAFGFTLNDNNGKPDKIVLMHENITERKNAEALLDDIIENNPLSIQVVDKDGYTIRGNPAFIKLFGSAPPPEFSIFDDLKSKSPDLGKLVSRVKNGEIAHLPDIYFNAHDAIEEAPDIPLWIRALIFPLKDIVGKPERFVFMHENITERKIAEQELIKAKEHAEESDRLKSAFLANMSHEIRTPMNGILGFSELLKNPGLTGKQQQEYIGIIEKSGARMLNIINDIVDISKIEAGLMNVSIRETDINEKIEYIYMFFQPQVEEKGMQLLFRNSLPQKEAIIKTDNEKVNSILSNLVKNAIKFSEEGSIEFGYERKGNDLEFFVKDTGIGIPKERQEAIFERFIQADISDKMARQGAGLGLSISKAYVEMLGGKIWVESEIGIGTTFYFTLPYNTGSEEKKTDEKSVPVQNENNLIVPGLKIVIAEDDETSEMLISINIREFSKEIIKVRSGDEVVEVCRRNPDIDLVLMDIQMPGMNGYEATRLIRQFNQNVIIIAQTAFGLTGDKKKSIEAGCNDYISKPIKKDELMALINKYFRK